MKKMKRPITVLLWFPQVGKAVVQGESDHQYAVDYVHQTCMCGDFEHRHRVCKHIRHVLDQLTGNTPPWSVSGA